MNLRKTITTAAVALTAVALIAPAAAGAVSLLPLHWGAGGEARSGQPSKQGDAKMATKDEFRSFTFHAPEAELAGLRKRNAD